MKHFAAALVIIVSTGLPAWPKVMVVFRLASPPMPVMSGQQFSLCAANVGTSNTDLTLEFVSVRSGAVITSREVILPPPGTSGTIPDPCLTVSADTISAGGNSPLVEPPMVVGLVVTRRGLFARPVAVTAAVQVTGLNPAGERRVIASVPLHVATLTNGRNTPIETVP